MSAVPVFIGGAAGAILSIDVKRCFVVWLLGVEVVVTSREVVVNSLESFLNSWEFHVNSLELEDVMWLEEEVVAIEEIRNRRISENDKKRLDCVEEF